MSFPEGERKVWFQAMQKEVQSHLDIPTFRAVKWPAKKENIRVWNCLWAFDLGLDKDGQVAKRLCFQGLLREREFIQYLI